MIGPVFNEDSLASGREMPNVWGALPLLLVYLGGSSAHTEESSFGEGVKRFYLHCNGDLGCLQLNRSCLCDF